MSPAFAGQKVVVVGGSGGIGAAVLAAAIAAGAEGIAVSRSGTAPADASGIAVDAVDTAALTAAVTSLGTIDHLVFTAAPRVGAPPLAALDNTALAALFQVKLFAPVASLRAALPAFAPHGSVTLTSGQVARKHGVGSLLNGVVNAAVEAGARHLARELAPIRVNAVSPGVIDTDAWGAGGSEARTATLGRIGDALPAGRVGSLDEAAAAYLFVMANGFVTGAVIDVNGGGLL